MTRTKLFEVRDAATMIGCIATSMDPDENESEAERYLLRRAGYDQRLIMLSRLDGSGTAIMPYERPSIPRTLGIAHMHISANWDSLYSGDVIDVEFILGETDEPKSSESKLG